MKPSNNKPLIINLKINKPVPPLVFILNQEINEVQFPKHLGIHISADYSWHKHIVYVKSKIWFRINVTRTFKYNLNRNAVKPIYIAFIRPILEYADVEKYDLENI